MGFYVPYDYLKLYSSKTQSEQTLDIILIYANKFNVITDATAGIGGNSIYFSIFRSVNCVEINFTAFKILIKNLRYKSNINFYNNDFMNIYKKLKNDIIFLDPPWEENYKNKKNSQLFLSNIHIKTIIEKLYIYANLLILKCPMNFECIVNKWNFTTHYIYKHRTVIYKIIVFHKY
jgi:16S rRNA G966 N2-methylase RsmD